MKLPTIHLHRPSWLSVLKYGSMLLNLGIVVAALLVAWTSDVPVLRAAWVFSAAANAFVVGWAWGRDQEGGFWRRMCEDYRKLVDKQTTFMEKHRDEHVEGKWVPGPGYSLNKGERRYDA